VQIGVEICSPSAADAQELFCLAKTAFGDLPGWDDGEVLDVLRRDIVFMATDEGVVAGYVALGRDDDGTLVVDQLLVAPGHERRGVGRRLLAHAEEYAVMRGVPELLIVVEADNVPAQNFYRRSGFVPVEPELYRRVLPPPD
jgi:ribosomal protein S18 acetylase RimI-like enzyme